MVEFVSQRNTCYSEIGCGVAACMMLLKTAGYNTPNTFKEMGDLLCVDVPPGKKWGKKFTNYGHGAYARDITKYLENNKIPYINIADERKHKISWASLNKLISLAPVMVGVIDKEDADKWTDGGHWVVLVEKVAGGKFAYYDPDYTKYKFANTVAPTMTTNELKNWWDGCAIVVLPGEN
jgi:hypothetical protein